VINEQVPLRPAALAEHGLIGELDGRIVCGARTGSRARS
jgi:hypothetical protein